MDEFDPNKPPLPEPRANHGHWQSHADRFLEEQDHPVQVAGKTLGQIEKLKRAEIMTMSQLASSMGTTCRTTPSSPMTLAYSWRPRSGCTRNSASLCRRCEGRLQADSENERQVLQLPTGRLGNHEDFAWFEFQVSGRLGDDRPPAGGSARRSLHRWTGDSDRVPVPDGRRNSLRWGTSAFTGQSQFLAFAFA